MRVGQTREAIAAREHDHLFVRSGGHDGNDRHALVECELDEAVTVSEHDLVAIAERTKRVEVRSRVDQHAVPGGEGVMCAVVTRTQCSQAARVAAQRFVLEQEVVGERVHRALGTEPVVDREPGEERLARQQATAVVSDQQHGTGGNVVDALDLEPEVVLTEPPEQIADQRHELGISRMDVVGGRAAGSSPGPLQRISCEPRDQPWWVDQDPAVGRRDQAARTCPPFRGFRAHRRDAFHRSTA